MVLPGVWGAWSSIWGFPYDPFLTPMLSRRSHLSRLPAFPALQHFVGQKEACALTGSLTLPVAKTRSGDSYTGTLQEYRLANGPSHKCYRRSLSA
ncbi:hypothetical protein PBY51_001417 [Eleginops maclovinus]|uniref:Uncharacterized protein n=1 Tax=Eleginops maclovinus TaxID=56733 RepID=A0AAN7WPV7_ELEMC|nr:hypothetical protein PBY51_001417 [Eleginops maclovinus]